MSTEAPDGQDSVPPLHSDDSLALDQQARSLSQTRSEDTVFVLALEGFPSLDNILIQNTPNLETVPDHGLNDDVTQISDLDTGNNALDDGQSDGSEDSTSQADNPNVNSEDSSAIPADQSNAQIVADMADLQFGTQQCYICTEDVCHSKVLQIGCGEHWICHNCIADPFELAIQHESHYPPKCCDYTGPLRIEDFEHLLAISHPDLAIRYTSKVQEYHMDKRFRRYCGAEDCDTFLNPDSYDRDEEHNLTTADCLTCNRTTCIFCTKIVFKAMLHECESALIKLNKDYSEEARFKYCPYCECPGLLDEGCNHVTCECGEEWCFVCIRKWNGGHGHEECGQYNVCQFYLIVSSFTKP
jgi:IBR domain, a half RING-finger domain